MKTLLKIAVLPVLLLMIQACSKEDNTNKITVQEHDKNQMMTLMHQMMTKMEAMTMTMDPDQDFAAMMKMHHEGAISMANAELKDGKDATIKAMAQKIITAQQAEITQLDAFMAGHAPHKMDMEFHNMMMTEMEKGGKQADLQLLNGNIDHDFSILMIGHHDAAIENSRMELIYGHDVAMKTMAGKIIKDQMAEIGEFQNWLISRGNK